MKISQHTFPFATKIGYKIQKTCILDLPFSKSKVLSRDMSDTAIARPPRVEDDRN